MIPVIERMLWALGMLHFAGSRVLGTATPLRRRLAHPASSVSREGSRAHRGQVSPSAAVRSVGLGVHGGGCRRPSECRSQALGER